MKAKQKFTVCHYALGLSPCRSGGTTYFVDELLALQSKKTTVSFLFPGKYNLFYKRTKIVRSKLYKHYPCFEIINPKPIPICNGIKDFDNYQRQYDKAMFIDFFNKYQISIIHIHTLMGLDLSFFSACKECGVKTIYTTHDIFGICPIASPQIDFNICKGEPSQLCSLCCNNAFSTSKIKVLQSHFYLKHKNGWLSKLLRKKGVKNRQEYAKKIEPKAKSDLLKLFHTQNSNYKQLQSYYFKMIMAVDHIHFNSSVTKDFFQKHLSITDNFSIDYVSHLGISDKRIAHKKVLNHSKIQLVLLGNLKGASMLFDVLDSLWNKGHHNFHLTIYSKENVTERVYLSKYGPYKINDIERIYSNANLLIMPSQSIETFSFIGLEALTHMVPCAVSSTVGISDLIRKYDAGFVCEPCHESWIKTLEQVFENPEDLNDKTKNINKIDLGFINDDFLAKYEKWFDVKIDKHTVK